MADVLTRAYGPAQPANTAANLYGPVGASKVFVIRNVTITNTTDTSAWFSLSVGTTAIDTAASRIFDKLEIPSINSSNHGLVMVEPTMVVVAAGEYITGKASASTTVTVTINGILVDV